MSWTLISLSATKSVTPRLMGDETRGARSLSHGLQSTSRAELWASMAKVAARLKAVSTELSDFPSDDTNTEKLTAPARSRNLIRISRKASRMALLDIPE